MIPKIIHYCWFGGSPLDQRAQTCMASWKKYLPGWQIQEWNEKNFDIHINPYVEEAYRLKKWAFVSDYARLAILEEYGGIYLDTDVELVRGVEDLVAKGAFMGIESCTAKQIFVNPGLLMAAEPHNPVLQDIRATYETERFVSGRGDTSGYTIVRRTSQILREKYRLAVSDTTQVLEGITIYPKRFFCPMDYKTGKLQITEDTRSIHWYEASWLEGRQKKRHANAQKLLRQLPNGVAGPVVFCYTKWGACLDILRSKGISGLFRRIFQGKY